MPRPLWIPTWSLVLPALSCLLAGVAPSSPQAEAGRETMILGDSLKIRIHFRGTVRLADGHSVRLTLEDRVVLPSRDARSLGTARSATLLLHLEGGEPQVMEDDSRQVPKQGDWLLIPRGRVPTVRSDRDETLFTVLSIE